MRADDAGPSAHGRNIEEPAMRPQLDDRGRLQETEPYAALSMRLLPAASVLVLVVGGVFAWLAFEDGSLGAAATWAGLAIVLSISCVLGFVQARRARRSDRRNAQQER